MTTKKGKVGRLFEEFQKIHERQSRLEKKIDRALHKGRKKKDDDEDDRSILDELLGGEDDDDTGEEVETDDYDQDDDDQPEID